MNMKDGKIKMPNKKYLKGVRKERKLVNELKEQGYEIAQRTAGSHSPIDLFGINKKEKIIKFIQSKPDDYPPSKCDFIKEIMDYLNWGGWTIKFELR